MIFIMIYLINLVNEVILFIYLNNRLELYHMRSPISNRRLIRFKSSGNIHSDQLDYSHLNTYHNIYYKKNSFDSNNERKNFHSPNPLESEIAMKTMNYGKEKIYSKCQSKKYFNAEFSLQSSQIYHNKIIEVLSAQKNNLLNMHQFL